MLIKNPFTRRRRELEAEVARLNAELDKPFELRMSEFSAGMRAIDATFEHPLIETISETMMRFFQEAGGTNFIETKCEIRFSGEINGRREMFTFTLQRVEGLTPSELRDQANARADVFERAAIEAQSQLEELQQLYTAQQALYESATDLAKGLRKDIDAGWVSRDGMGLFIRPQIRRINTLPETAQLGAMRTLIDDILEKLVYVRPVVADIYGKTGGTDAQSADTAASGVSAETPNQKGGPDA
jgi:hypothetical protein